MMLPKILHYIWIGNPKTELANRCIDSFHQFMSDYKIIELNESNITEYFCQNNAKSGEISITYKTISIHHYTLSWCDRSNNSSNK